MPIIYNGDAEAAPRQLVEEVVAWSRIGEQFVAALEEADIQLQCTVKSNNAHPTHYAGGAHGGTLWLNMDALNLLTIGKKSATILHELFHCVHRTLHRDSYIHRNQTAGAVGQGLGGWVGGSAEEQLAITGHLCMVGNPNAAIIAWAARGFCENRVLRHLGYPLRNSHLG